MPKDTHSIRFEPDVWDVIGEIADEEGRTRNDVVRRMVNECIERRRQATERK